MSARWSLPCVVGCMAAGLIACAQGDLPVRQMEADAASVVARSDARRPADDGATVTGPDATGETSDTRTSLPDAPPAATDASTPDSGGDASRVEDARPPTDGAVQVGPATGGPAPGCPLPLGTTGPALLAPLGPWNVGGVGRFAPTSTAHALADGVRLVGGLKGGKNFDGKVESRPDELFFVHKPVEGDLTFTAKVASLTGISGFGLAGLTIRADLNPCGLQASVVMGGSTDHSAIFNCRRNPFPGSSCATKVSKPGSVPGWLRLTRAGDQITVSFSGNGSSWTVVGSQTIKLPRTVHAGFLISQDGTVDVSFTNVTITSP